MKRFRGLPKKQRECFEKIAAGARFRHHPRTLAILEHKGLIEFETMTVKFPGRLGSITATLPYVPIPIHMEWCQWCAEQAGSRRSRSCPHLTHRQGECGGGE